MRSKNSNLRMMLTKAKHSSKNRRSQRDVRRHGMRSAVATVELAICLPVLSLVVFGSIQATNLIFLQHAVTAAAYEGTLEMAKSNATNSTVQSRVQQVLDAREVTNSTISILPIGTDIATIAPGSMLTIEVTADVRTNSSVLGFFSTQDRVNARIVATR